MNGRYEIPVPLKPHVINKMADNFHSAADRTLALRKKALEDVGLQQILVDTFRELIREGWLVPVKDSISGRDRCWYLPFFVSKQDKPRVVFDGAAAFQGLSLYDAVLPGVNLLNGLVGVLTRFRTGRFACIADISQCFSKFQCHESYKIGFV